jgi:murein DD-endopeptidase MepM/ murein hydrolase activator NlpD
MAFFPLPAIPKDSYRTLGRSFGSDRPNDRKHAGCDLMAAEGTDIRAVDDGEVFELVPDFFHGTGAIALRHKGFIARYCEVKTDSLEGIKRGQLFKAGEVIAKVGKMYSLSMLHFELYSGQGTGGLTVRTNLPYQRRSDLLNPAGFLDQLAGGSGGPVMIDAKAWAP